jgi:twitching motility protein PilI
MALQNDLRALRDRPYEILQELERRGRAAAGGRRAVEGAEWVGVAFRLGQEFFLVPRDEMREVMAMPPKLTRIPGARPWILGLCNLRGQLLPVVDLRQFLGSGVTPATRAARVLVVNHREIPVGLLVDEVVGFRRFAEAERATSAPPTLIRCEQFLIGSFRRSGESWPVIGLRKLIEHPSFLQASA